MYRRIAAKGDIWGLQSLHISNLVPSVHIFTRVPVLVDGDMQKSVSSEIIHSIFYSIFDQP